MKYSWNVHDYFTWGIVYVCVHNIIGVDFYTPFVGWARGRTVHCLWKKIDEPSHQSSPSLTCRPQSCWGPVSEASPIAPFTSVFLFTLKAFLRYSPLLPPWFYSIPFPISPLFAFLLCDCIINSGRGLSCRQMKPKVPPCQRGEYDFKRTDRRHFQSLSVIRSAAAHRPRGLMRRRRCAVLLGVPVNSALWRWIWNRGLRREPLMVQKRLKSQGDFYFFLLPKAVFRPW